MKINGQIISRIISSFSQYVKIEYEQQQRKSEMERMNRHKLTIMAHPLFCSIIINHLFLLWLLKQIIQIGRMVQRHRL